MYKIEVLTEARIQITIAFEWYLSKSHSAAANFVLELESAFRHLEAGKATHRKVTDVYHEFVFKKFPFLLIYRIEQKKRKKIVVALFNTWQDPKKKSPKIRA